MVGMTGLVDSISESNIEVAAEILVSIANDETLTEEERVVLLMQITERVLKTDNIVEYSEALLQALEAGGNQNVLNPVIDSVFEEISKQGG